MLQILTLAALLGFNPATYNDDTSREIVVKRAVIFVAKVKHCQAAYNDYPRFQAGISSMMRSPHVSGFLKYHIVNYRKKHFLTKGECDALLVRRKALIFSNYIKAHFMPVLRLPTE